MQLPHGATVAVADGEKFNLFRNSGDEARLKLEPVAHDAVDDQHSGGAGRHSSSGNPDESQINEDGFSAGVADQLNASVLSGKITSLLIIAAPRTLGAMRKRYHAKLTAALLGEIAKDLTGRNAHDVEAVVAAA